MKLIWLCLAVLVYCLLSPYGIVALGDEALFREQVAPVLERRCLECHNEQRREGGLSLVTRESARAGGDSGGPVEAGDPESSLLWLYVTGDKPEMPKSGPPLEGGEVDALRRWIEAGADWPRELHLEDRSLAGLDWWSLHPLRRPAVPALSREVADRARTPVDHFIMARLHEHGWQLAPEADRRTLARRLHYDLTGLPPSPSDVQRFVDDPSPTAYEQLVDRLLASPQYGERWARHWLDVVKYADTCGYDKDKLRPHAWPYRDYVIDSFNRDKHYTRFVHEQLAGDVLFPALPDGILGLGFIAAGPWDFIGHVEVPEAKIDGRIARHIDRDEMVSNTLNTFISTTVQCARCHNHKFDPITQQHYYNLQSVFSAVDRADRTYDRDPQVERRRRELAASRESVERELAEWDKERRTMGGERLALLEKRVSDLRQKSRPQDKDPAFGYHSQLAKLQDTTKWVQVDLGQPRTLQRIVLKPCHDDFAGIGAGFGFPVRYRIEASLEHDFPSNSTLVLVDRSHSDNVNPGLAEVEFVIGEGRGSADDPIARYVRITATRLAERKNDFMLALAELQVFDNEQRNVAAGAKVSALDSIEAPIRWSRSNLTDGIWARPVDAESAQQLTAARRELAQLLGSIDTPERLAVREALRAKLGAIKSQIDAIPAGRMVYAAATSFEPRGNFHPTNGTPRPIHVLHRGNILEPREAAQPGVIPVIGGESDLLDLPEEHREGERRAALARWITRHDHPLTWRSIVNRIWQHHFGQGLVDTPNDFGRMGQMPTHPDLLDWLAVEFRDNGQSIKQMHRLLVTSEVYRQASRSSGIADSSDGSSPAVSDANNRLLWRANRRRLSAEEVRDTVLSASGRLEARMGGPGFYLFELEKTDHSPHYEYHKFDPTDPVSHRRSIYRFIVRSQPDPFMTTLDCADSSQSTPRRDETLTSLQALSLLNNKFTLAMSEYFAERLRRECSTAEEQIERAMWLLVSRPPTPDERAALLAYRNRHGLENTCRVLFNLSEVIFVD